MIKAVKKDSGSFVYMRVKKHTCPDCEKELKIVKMKKTVKASTKEAAGFDFSAAGHPLGERVKFIWYEFKCPDCERQFTESEMQMIEKKAKEAERQAKKDAIEAAKAEKKAEKKAAAKAAREEKKARKTAEREVLDTESETIEAKEES